MGKKIFILIVLLLMNVLYMKAADISFKAYSSRNTVRVGERFRIVFTINKQASNFRPPAFPGLSILSGPSTSSQTKIEMINGIVNQFIEHSITYLVQADEIGTITIAPATIIAGGKQYQSNPLNIQVVENNAASGQNNNQGSNQNTENSDKDIFLTVSVDKTNPYIGEQVIITYKLFFKVNIKGFDTKQLPNYSGFWTQDLLDNHQNYTTYDQVVNGTRYRVAEIKKEAIFPQKAGKLSINPMQVEVLAQIATNRNNSNDPFDAFFEDFFKTYKNVKKLVASNAVIFNVKPLPDIGKPGNFGGAVGSFSFDVALDTSVLRVNEAFSLKFTISGKGNLKLIEDLNIELPPDFEVYDPKVKENINTGANGISGTKTFEYLLIPRSPGNFTIKPVTFTFFDPNSGNYKTLRSEAYKINIRKQDGSYTYSNTPQLSREKVELLNKDIKFIKTNNFKLKQRGDFFFLSGSFFLFLAIPFFVFILLVFLQRRQIKRNRDLIMVKNRKATNVAKKRLKIAGKFLKNKQEKDFYDEIFRALWGYLSDKLIIPVAELSKENVSAAFEKRNVDSQIGKNFLDTIDHCEYARFAPKSTQSHTMEDVYDEAIETIAKIERELR